MRVVGSWAGGRAALSPGPWWPSSQVGTGSPGLGQRWLPSTAPRVLAARTEWQQVSGRAPPSFPTFSLNHSGSCCRSRVGDLAAHALESFAGGVRCLREPGHPAAVSLPCTSPAHRPPSGAHRNWGTRSFSSSLSHLCFLVKE